MNPKPAAMRRYSTPCSFWKKAKYHPESLRFVAVKAMTLDIAVRARNKMKSMIIQALG
jgi:hypothetical protein